MPNALRKLAGDSFMVAGNIKITATPVHKPVNVITRKPTTRKIPPMTRAALLAGDAGRVLSVADLR